MMIRVNGRELSVRVNPQTEECAEVAVCPPVCGGEIRVETAVPFFSADALCAAALIAALRRGETARCVVLTESAAANAVIPAVVEPDNGNVTVVLPVPAVRTENTDVCCLRWPGLDCCVSTGALPEKLPESPALYVLRDSKCEMLRMWLYDGLDAAWTELSASGLAAASAAVDMARSLDDGVMEYGIGMPGGTVEVGVSKRGGVLCGVSVCSAVSIDREEVLS